MYEFEHLEQPDKFPDIISSFWWATATLTTIGYGDVYPITGIGKFFSAIISIVGIGIVALPTGIISSGFIEELRAKKEESEKKIIEKSACNYCPNCGFDLKTRL